MLTHWESFGPLWTRWLQTDRTTNTSQRFTLIRCTPQTLTIVWLLHQSSICMYAVIFKIIQVYVWETVQILSHVFSVLNLGCNFSTTFWHVFFTACNLWMFRHVWARFWVDLNQIWNCIFYSRVKLVSGQCNLHCCWQTETAYAAVRCKYQRSIHLMITCRAVPFAQFEHLQETIRHTKMHI